MDAPRAYVSRTVIHSDAQMALFVRVFEVKKEAGRAEDATTTPGVEVIRQQRVETPASGVHNATEEAGVSLILIGS